MGALPSLTLHILTLVLMRLSLMLTLIPIFPGLIIIWVLALGYGLIAGFGWVGVVVFVVMTLLMIAGSLVDNILMGAKALESGATWVTTLVSLLAGIVGTVILPPFGGILFALVGIFLIEYIRLRDWRKAFQSMRGMATGWGWSVIARFGMGVVMVGIWVIWAITRYNG